MRDLFRNRARTLLTLLGVIIGSGSIVGLASLLAGAEEALVRLNQGVQESDTLWIGRDEPPRKQAGRTTRPLSAADGEALAALPGASATIEGRRESTAYRDGREKRVRLMGTGVEAPSMYRLTLRRGRFLSADDLRQGRRVAVIGDEIYRELLAKEGDGLGAQLRVDDEVWTVVGVLAHKPVMGHGTGTWMWDRKVLVPRSAFDATYSPSREVQAIFLRGENITALGRLAGSLLLRRHLGVKNFQVEDKQQRNQEKVILMIIQVLLLSTALMSLFVGGINIMNIMLVTVSERTKEIGIRRALGATPAAIMRQFVLEAATVSSAGGVIGVCTGALLSWLLALGLRQAFGTWPYHLIPWSIAAALALAVITGAAFGLLPAWRASKLSPVEALRAD